MKIDLCILNLTTILTCVCYVGVDIEKLIHWRLLSLTELLWCCSVSPIKERKNDVRVAHIIDMFGFSYNSLIIG